MSRRLLISLVLLASVVPATPALADVPDTYVAMGDSFTSGPFVPMPTGDPVDCGRSTKNYPQLVASSVRAPVFRDVSCGGADTDDFARAQDGLPMGGTNPPQYDALGPEVALVTVGIGGNDIGFGGIAEDCVQPPGSLGTPCSQTYTEGGRDELAERIEEAAPKVRAALQGIVERAPNAEVFVLDYPAIVPDRGSGCYPYLPIRPEDVPYLRAVHKKLNAMIADQATAVGAVPVDWYAPSIGHDACELPGTAWVNGAVVVPPSFPAHPNGAGMKGAATAVRRAVGASGFVWPA